jgi:hypothetical protein
MMASSSSALRPCQHNHLCYQDGFSMPLIPVACSLDAILEKGADQIYRHLGLLEDLVIILLRCPLRRLLVVERGLSRPRTKICAVLPMSSLACRSGTLLVGRGLATVGTARARAATKMLVGELVYQAIGGLVELCLTLRGLRVALLALILRLPVRAVRKVAIAGVLVARAPDLLLTGLIGVYRLREGRGRGGKGPASVLRVLVSITAAEAKVEL